MGIFEMTKDKPEKKSPLKAHPLRNPGQSLDDEIQRIIDDEISMYAFFCVMPIALALLDWWRWYFKLPPTPIVWTGLALLTTPFLIYKLNCSRKKLKPLRLGRDGEKVVGQYLEMLRENGYRVLHDIAGEGFNVDHVVISPHGIFAIETKTISKPGKGESKVQVSENKLLVNGRLLDRDPLVQVKAASKWLSGLLKETTGKDFRIQPVVVFPGWWVEGKAPDVWVLEPKALPSFIENERICIKQEDVQLATYHLSRYIRALAK
jgi:hypothetical protein